jgi:hypothetical protein
MFLLFAYHPATYTRQISSSPTRSPWAGNVVCFFFSGDGIVLDLALHEFERIINKFHF